MPHASLLNLRGFISKVFNPLTTYLQTVFCQECPAEAAECRSRLSDRRSVKATRFTLKRIAKLMCFYDASSCVILNFQAASSKRKHLIELQRCDCCCGRLECELQISVSQWLCARVPNKCRRLCVVAPRICVSIASSARCLFCYSFPKNLEIPPPSSRYSRAFAVTRSIFDAQ